MKKLLILATFVSLLTVGFVAPLQGNAQTVSGAVAVQTFNTNLYYGLRNNADVTRLQTFLTQQGHYTGPITGNFYSLTLQGVRKFQASRGIITTGYFGPLSRAAANAILINTTNNLTITTASNLNATVGQYFVATFQVSGGNGSYSIIGSGNVPGLNFTGTYCGEGLFCAQVISPNTIYLVGRPTQVGTYNVTINAKDEGMVINCIQAEGCPESTPARYGQAMFTINVSQASVNSVAITSMTPDSGSVDATVTLVGRGFTNMNNTIHFGSGVVPGIASSDGTRLVFMVPSALSPACFFTTPRCLMAAQITQNGLYDVYVTNANGESNKVKFTVVGQDVAY